MVLFAPEVKLRIPSRVVFCFAPTRSLRYAATTGYFLTAFQAEFPSVFADQGML
jgi:hypothetical protein